MIFKTFNGDIDKMSSNWGMFGRSFNDIGTAIVGRIKDINKAFQATDDLTASFNDSDSIWKRLYPSKESIESKLINVDELIPEIDEDNFDFDGWISKLNDADKKVKAGISSWQDFSNELDDNQKWIAKWGQETEGQIRTQNDLVQANKKAREAAISHNKALKAQTFSAKAGSAALKALSAAGNMLAMWAVGEVLTRTITVIHDYAKSAEIAKEKSEALSSSLSESQNKYAEDSNRIDDLASQYNKLSKGVNHLGQNVSLSSSQYETYKSIVQQLSDLMPDLTTRINEQGEAIGFVGGKIADVKKEYQNYQKNQAIDFLLNGDSEGNTYQDAIDNLNEQLSEERNDLQKIANNAVSLFGGNAEDNFTTKEKINILKEIINANNKAFGKADAQKDIASLISGNLMSQKYGNYDTNAYLKLIGKGELEILGMSTDEFMQFIEQVSQKIEKYQQEYESSATVIKQGMNKIAFGKEEYWSDELGDSGREKISAILSGVTTDFLQNNDLITEESQRAFVQKLIDSISNNKDGFSDALGSLFKLNIEDMNIDDARAKIQEFCAIIAGVLKISLSDAQTLLGYEDFFQTASNYDRTVAYASGGNYKSAKNVDGSKGFNQKDVLTAMDENGINTDEEIDRFMEILNTVNTLNEAVDKYNEKTEQSTPTPKTFSEAWKSIGTTGSDEEKKEALEEKERLLELAETGKLTREELEKSSIADTFKDAGVAIEAAAHQLNKMKSSAEQLSSMKTGISSISSILWEKKSGNDIGADTLAGMSDEIKEQKKAYENFAGVLGSSSSSMDECRDAANRLATAYINNNNFLANLTDENKDYYISMLDEMGVENASEVVTDALAKKTGLLAAEKEFLEKRGRKLENATWDEITAFAEESKCSEAARDAIYQLALQKELANGTTLDTESDIQAVIKLVETLGGATNALRTYNSIKNGEYYVPSDAQKGIAQAAQEEVDDAFEKGKKKAKIKTKIKPSSSSKSSSSKSGSGSKSGSSKSSQEIDWIGRALDRLSSKLDLAKTKYDNLFDSKKAKNSNSLLSLQNKNLDRQYKILSKTEKYQSRAEKKYDRKAAGVKLSSSLKKAVREGRITGSMNQLIASYGEKKAEKIQKYQDWYDKAREAGKNRISTQAQKRENRIQKYQNTADSADQKASLAQARKENAAAAKDKNKFIDAEIKQTKRSYNNQIKIAKLEKDSLKVKQLQAEKEKEIRDLKIEQHQNLADEYQNALDRYSAEKENAAEASKKNELIDKEKSLTMQIYAEKTAIAELEGNSAEILKLQAELEKELRSLEIEKHQNLADEYQAQMDKTSAEKENLKTAADKNAAVDMEKSLTIQIYAEKTAIAKLEGNISEEQKLQAELTRQMVVLEKEKFDNITHYYENLLKIKNNSYADLASAADELEARGLIVGSRMYASQIAANGEKKSMYEEELLALNRQLHSIERNTDEWYEALDAIQSCETSIAECAKDTYALAQAMREAGWQLSSKITSRFEQISSEYDLLIKLMSNRKLTDEDTGNFTKEGTATLGAYYSQLLLARKETETLKEFLDGMWDNIQNKREGYTEQAAIDEYYEKYDEYIKMTGSLYDIQQNLIELMKEKYQTELGYLKDIIDKRKELLQAEKDEYDYRRTIEEKTENISVISKQISALSGDDSEYAKARIQQLRADLDDAKKDLRDTEYDRWISDQQKMLDNLYNEYEAFIDDKLNDVEALLSEAVTYLGSINIGEDVSEALSQYADEYHYDPTDDFQNINNALGENGSIAKAVSGVSNLISDYFHKQLEDTEDAGKVINLIAGIGQMDYDGEGRKRLVAAENAYNSLSEGAKAIVNSTSINGVTTLGQKQVEWLGLVQQKKAEEEAKAEAERRAKQEQENAAERARIAEVIRTTYLANGSLYANMNTGESVIKEDRRLNQLLKDNGLWRNEDNCSMSEAGAADIMKRLGYSRPEEQTLGALYQRMKQVGFAKGGVAEMLMKIPAMNGDDGWITVKKGEGILTPEQTIKFAEMAGNLDLLKSTINAAEELTKPKAEPAPHNIINPVGNVNLNVELPGVTNYEEFRQKMQSDPKIESMFKSMLWNNEGFSKYHTNM